MIINKDEFISMLTRLFSDNGMERLINREKVLKFYKLTEYMLEENEKYNLTAITDPEKIILLHYLDCAVLAEKLKKGASVADIGCGAGFPTLVLAILRDDLKITAIDSTAKRVDYVNRCAEMLELGGVRAIAMRAEDGGKSPEFREKYDYATARAVAELRILAELCMPYVKCGGKFIAMKGKRAEFELRDAKRAISMLGGKGAEIEIVNLTGSEELSHPLISVSKAEKTPAAYPRPYAQISKKPL